MPASSTSKDYDQNYLKWKTARDTVAGSHAIKTNDGLYGGLSNGQDCPAGSTRNIRYLPMPNPSDLTQENLERYRQYMTRAVFINFTANTKRGLSGAIFRKPPTVELGPQLEFLEDNSSGDGLSLCHLAKECVNEVLTVGNVGGLAQFPKVEEGLTREQEDYLQLRPSIKTYCAESIINVNHKLVGGKRIVCSISLLEYYDEPVENDPFDYETKEQILVLKLDEGTGNYVEEIWRDDELFEGPYEIKAMGKPLKFIPFEFIGSENNDSKFDPAPLYDIAEVNLGHYRNSADFEEASFISGQPTLFISSSMSYDEFKEANPNGIAVGSRAGHFLGDQGNGTLVQAKETSLAREGMKDKEEQLIKINARIIQQGKGTETAEAARIRFSGENSVLSNIAQNVSEGLTKLIGYCGLFVGVEDDEQVFELNQQFFDTNLDAQQISAQILMLDRGILAMEDIRNNVRKAGMVADNRTDEDIEAEAQEMDPLQ